MNRFLTVVSLFAFTLILTPKADAQGIDILRMVDTLFSTTEQTSYDPGETPTLYIRLSAAGSANVASYWQAPYTAPAELAINSGSSQDRWLQLASWDAVKAAGDWSVNANVFFPNGSTDVASTNFTVTPEPISTTLFLLGGAPLAAHLYRRKKTAKV